MSIPSAWYAQHHDGHVVLCFATVPSWNNRQMAVTAPPPRPRRQRLGDILVADGLATQEQLNAALARQKRTGERLGRLLVSEKVLTEAQLVSTLARQFGLDAVDLEEHVPDFNASRLLRESFARRHKALPIG